MSSRRPLKWMREATPEEISEALVSVDVEKAAAVAGILLTRCGQVLGARMDAIIQRYHNPGDAVVDFVKSGLRGMFS